MGVALPGAPGLAMLLPAGPRARWRVPGGGGIGAPRP
jgi:hypothetical protein